MTDIDLYNQLPLNNKLTLLKYKATLLQAFKEDDKTYAVYALNGYYVEMVSKSETNKLITVDAFKNKERVIRFLDKLPLIYLYS